MKKRWIFGSLIALVLFSVVGWKLYGLWLKHRLESYRQQLVLQGEKLTVEELLEGRIRPARNSADHFFRATALIYRDGVTSTNPPSSMKMVAPGKAMIGWQQPHWVDYSSKPPATNTWDELAADLTRSEPGIRLLHEIIETPELDFGVDYYSGEFASLPHLAPIKSSIQLLHYAALLELRRSNTHTAAQHLRAALAIVQGQADERYIISQLVRAACAQIVFHACWEFLQSPATTETDLKLLQEQLAALDFVPALQHSLKMERVLGGQIIRRLRETGGVYDMYAMTPPGGGTGTNLSDKLKDKAEKYLSPRKVRKNSNELLWQSALAYEDERRNLEGMQALIDCARAIHTNGAFSDALSNTTTRLAALDLTEKSGSQLWSENPDLSLQALRDTVTYSPASLLKTLHRLEFVEARRALTVTAFALKRYELEHGKLPDTLSGLTPKFLATVPRDPVDGRPLRYRRHDDGTFTLYSIGADAIDDGGDAEPADKSRGGSLNQQLARDWVWPQPTNTEEIRHWQESQQSRK